MYIDKNVSDEHAASIFTVKVEAGCSQCYLPTRS